MQRNLEERAPALPATTMTLDRVRKGVFFSFKAYKDLWPAVAVKDWNKQAALLMTELQPLVRKSEWHMMTLFGIRVDIRSVQELRYPDAWEHLMAVDGMAYYDAVGKLVAEGGHVFRSAERDRMYRLAIEADNIRPDTRAVCELIEELR